MWFGIDDLVFTVGGGLLGAGAQLVSDAIFKGELSSGQDLAAAFVGGAVTAEVGLYTVPTLGPAGLIVAGAAGGAAGDLTNQAIGMYNDPTQEFNWAKLAFDTGVGGLTGLIPGAEIEGITAGSNSFNAIFNQIATKAINGTISDIADQTALKMFVGSAVDGALFEGLFTGSTAGTAFDALEKYLGNLFNGTAK
jgi:type VI secretion system secreted protein VgrG